MGGPAGIADLATNRLAADVTWTFTTASGTSTTSYLSDLPFTQVANGWGPVERDTSNGEQAAGDGKPLSLRGVVYPKGLGGHAASDVRYAMNGGCTSFSAKVGVDDETGANGSVDFQVFGDGTKLADSGLMTATTATQTADRRRHRPDDPPARHHRRRQRHRLRPRRLGRRQAHLRWRRPAADTTPPTVTATTPASGATGVGRRDRPDRDLQRGDRPDDPHDAPRSPSSSRHDDPARRDRRLQRRRRQTATLTPDGALGTPGRYVRAGRGRYHRHRRPRRQPPRRRRHRDVHDRSGTSTTTYLSDLAFTTVANGWGPVEKDTQQRRAGGRRRQAAHPQRCRLSPRASASTPRPTSATR